MMPAQRTPLSQETVSKGQRLDNLIRTLIVLSAPPVIRRVPVMSNVEQNIPASASSEPGCGMSSMFWNGVPVA